MTLRVAIAVGLCGLSACSAPPAVWAPLGDASYRTATVCVSEASGLAPIVSDAAARWRAADPAIAMAVRLDPGADAEFPTNPACDISARFVTAVDGSGSADAFTGASSPGRMQIVNDPAFAGLLSDTVTHELGHFLIGPDAAAHSKEPASVMYPYIDADAGEKEILASDVAKLGRSGGSGS